MKQITLLLTLLSVLLLTSCEPSSEQEYFQIKIYSYDTEEQEARLDQYLEDAYLPALHSAGLDRIGVFKPIEGKNEDKMFVMVLLTFQSLEEFEQIPVMLARDEEYMKIGKDYIEAAHDNPPYSRIESTLLRAFSATPKLQVPEFDSPASERVYELRSYEGATEQLYNRKVEMFNEGESALFEKLEFNPVFFGEVISSAHMPHLMYMTTFSDTLSQKEHWDAFRVHPEWLEMKEIERYKNTVSHITRYLMFPTGYSDI